MSYIFSERSLYSRLSERNLIGLITLLLVEFTGSMSHIAAQETNTSEKTLNFDAATLQIKHLSARLSVETTSEPGIRVNLTGSSRQIESILTEQKDSLLILKGSLPETSNTLSIHSNGSSTVIVSGNSRAHVTIGGSDESTIITPADEPLLQVTVQLAETTPISISGFNGFATLAALQAPLSLELNGGDVELAAVRDADLSIAGSGHIALDRARGNLSLSVRGSGDIVVADARLHTLGVAILGAGNIQIGGQSEQAALSLSGAGNIYVEHVVQKPQRQLLGVGTIRIGNW